MPPSAAWNLPSRVLLAPVNAPLTWPKSSLSSSDSGMAPQLMVTNGPSARGERWWISWAMSSLPVPVSPVTSTLTVVGATFSTVRKISFMASHAPMMLPKRISESRSLSSFCRAAARAP